MSESSNRISGASALESASLLANMVEEDVTKAWRYRDNIRLYIEQNAENVMKVHELEVACTEYYGDLSLIANTFRHWFADHGYVDAFNSLALEINEQTKRYDVDLHLRLYKAEFSGEISFYAIDSSEAQSVIDQLEIDIENELQDLDGYETSSVTFDGPSPD
jgi:hypothetical protein